MRFLEREVFGRAQDQIIICSPFIRLSKLREVFSASRLQSLNHRKVRVHLFTLPTPCDRNPEEQEPIFQYLQSLNRTYLNFTFGHVPNLHTKTLIVDKCLLLEGSFNLFSAVSETLHDANNFEMSVALIGNDAEHWISQFHQTPLAQSIPKGPSGNTTASFPKRSSGPDSNRHQKSRKQESDAPLQIPKNFARHIEIFSGNGFNRKGYCVRLDRSYIRDEEGDIAYFSSPTEAEKIAYQVWLEEE